jgi:hypothetical protein
MDDVDRLLAVDYQPSDQDAVKARLSAVGVQEYHFSIPRGGMSTTFDAIVAHFRALYQTKGTRI